ncbi:MAG: hypothetical protein A2W91_14675 [Bacteroidetes bacterium GWF2_38_335]|nr:MAG: hypothetical protein A2W91_14675 [Bacteroidetes bacterium GWF2_38_335]OFY78447.1 MAG: hypothetical protein A2281_15985 [Bacteroidetes bacterium RIFOXYA12_FULL_38_20]HBS88392.1 endonuclease [Bacteroidales bacterium]
MDIFVYILFSIKDDDRFEFGFASDLETRIKAHNQGLSPLTKNFRPWKLFATKKVETRSQAAIMVKDLRRMKSKDGMVIYMLQNDFVVSKE